MKHLLLLLTTFFILGCSTTSLTYQHNKITLEDRDRSYTFHGETLYKSQQNLSQISIRQYLFTDAQNENLVYEYARLNMGYKFKYTYSYILRNVFDAKHVKAVTNKDGLGFFVITLSDKSSINLIAKTGTKKSLSMLYGFSDKNFKAMIENKELTKQKKISPDPKEAIQSQWNIKLILTGVLLEKEGGKLPYYK